ncbi:hypothetical protein [Paludisphaera rhizosphaerae]|nr:hypothetical protein [Paludisphaera rhizosphaerae]
MATVTIPDLSAVYSWLKANWGSIAARTAVRSEARRLGLFPSK